MASAVSPTNASVRSGLPACIPMSAAAIPTIRWLKFRSSGSCRKRRPRRTCFQVASGSQSANLAATRKRRKTKTAVFTIPVVASAVITVSARANIPCLVRIFCRAKAAAAIPRIHESVLARIKNHAHLYAPAGPAGGIRRCYVIGRSAVAAAKSLRTAEAGCITRAIEQEKVWNTIWLKRIVYFLTVTVTIYLVIFPLLRALPPN